MKQVRRFGVGVDEDRAPQGLARLPRQQGGAEALEHGFAGVHPECAVRGFRAVDRQAAPQRFGISVHRFAERIGSAGLCGNQVENAVGVAFQPQVRQGAGGLHESGVRRLSSCSMALRAPASVAANSR